GSFEQAFVLTVNDINQAPTGIMLSSSSFNEGTSPGTTIATLTAVDANVGDSHTFALASGDGSNDADNGSFIVVGNELKVNVNSSFETQPSYNVYLSVADGEGSFEQAFVLTVNDSNQPPTGINLTAISFNEGTTPGTTIATITADDINGGDTHTFSLAAGDGSNDADNGSFIVVGNSLIINTISRFETQSSYNIYLSSADDQGSFEQAFLIGVNDVNQAPTAIELSASSLDEGTSAGTTVATISVTDPNAGDSHTLSLASGDGSNDANNNLFVIAGNNLILVGNVNFNTNQTLSILIAASDGEETFEQAFTLNVNDVLGLAEELSNELGIYPNPGNDRLEINLDNDETGQMVIKISDLAGRVIHTYASEKNENKWTDRIDMTSAEPGIYIVEVAFETKKFIQRWIKE
ncbi:MAG: T9SS type A sorting domain-containing protein, partial [Cyclobacteriaceae bacterium]